jgi:phospholipid/cholesterol/gamma-HCH transport system ATP-binding protein
MSISVQNLHKTLHGQAILRGVDFDLPTGSLTFLLGKSGTGKSVLLKHLIGMMQPDQGNIYIHDQSITEIQKDAWPKFREKWVLVPQQPALLDDFTIEANLQLVCPQDPIRLHEVVEEVNLPKSILNLKPSELSYGMQKRASIARALLMEPELLLFDEPTTGLDPVRARSLYRLIQKISRLKYVTSLVVCHDIFWAYEFASRIVILDEGQVIFDDAKEALPHTTHPLLQALHRESERPPSFGLTTAL